MNPTDTSPLLSGLLDVHTTLDELFAAHQVALVERNLPAANAWLEQFATTLRAHIADEEEQILPLYAERVTIPEGGRTEFFLAEHGKLLGTLEELEGLLMGLEVEGTPVQYGDQLAPATPDAVDVRRVIALLDKETSFKDLLAHHDARERSFLYPLLDAVISPEERTQYWGQIALHP